MVGEVRFGLTQRTGNGFTDRPDSPTSALSYIVELQVGFEPTREKPMAYKTIPIDHYGTAAFGCMREIRTLSPGYEPGVLPLDDPCFIEGEETLPVNHILDDM